MNPAPAPSPGMPVASALPALLDRYGPRLHGLALRLCRNRADADDLVQEVFLRALRAWPRFQGRSDPGTWLYTIAGRACRERTRRKGGSDRRAVAMSQLMPWRESTITAVAAAPDPDARALAAERAESVARVQHEITRLPEHLRLPLVLKEVLGLSVDDTAAALGLAANTIKTRLHRARLALRKAMTARAAAVPAPAPIYEKQVCLDLLKAKMDAMDRGGTAAGFAVPKADLCARCRAVFRELDLVQDACADLAGDDMPPALRRRIIEAIQRHEAHRPAALLRRGRRPVRAGR